jgi:hypothetical protein
MRRRRFRHYTADVVYFEIVSCSRSQSNARKEAFLSACQEWQLCRRVAYRSMLLFRNNHANKDKQATGYIQ